MIPQGLHSLDSFGAMTRPAARFLDTKLSNQSFSNSITKMLMIPTDARLETLTLAESWSWMLHTSN
jgi:hypothetical protein